MCVVSSAGRYVDWLWFESGCVRNEYSVHRTLIKVYQCSIIKQPTPGSTWDLVIPKFHYDLRPSEIKTEYRLHFSTKIYTYILLKKIVYILE